MCLFVFLFKQKTAYDMRISDWSSDVCSSDLQYSALAFVIPESIRGPAMRACKAGCRIKSGMTKLVSSISGQGRRLGRHAVRLQSGRASCRERVCQYV